MNTTRRVFSYGMAAVVAASALVSTTIARALALDPDAFWYDEKRGILRKVFAVGSWENTEFDFPIFPHGWRSIDGGSVDWSRDYVMILDNRRKRMYHVEPTPEELQQMKAFRGSRPEWANQFE